MMNQTNEQGPLSRFRNKWSMHGCPKTSDRINTLAAMSFNFPIAPTNHLTHIWNQYEIEQVMALEIT